MQPRHTVYILKSDRPWRVVLSMTFEEATKAEAFERYLKSGSGRAFASRHLR